MTASAIETIVADLTRNAHLPFEQARSMPTGVYTSPEFLKLE